MFRINPIHCILPPHMLDEIADKGSDVQKELASKARELSNTIRAEREGIISQITAQGADARSDVKQRVVYDARTGRDLPGDPVRREGDPPTDDDAVNEAYDGSGVTFDLFNDVYDRNSIDDDGMVLHSTVHFEQGYDNAFWNGRQMVYGDGDEDLPESQRLFNRFTTSLDIIGHELTHGVTEFEARLVYRNQPGALNESFSDVFGSLVKQHARNQTAAQGDWTIGEGLLTSNVNGTGIRSLSAPGTAYDDPVLGKDIQPGHMRDFQDIEWDNGGVHINSGIPNHAFYLTAMELGGNAWEKAGRIWYIALRDKLRARSQFQDAANLTYQTAGEIFGRGSIEQQAVRKGWAGVGLNIEVEETPPPPSPPPPDDGQRKPGCMMAAVPAAVIGLVAAEGARRAIFSKGRRGRRR